MAKENNKSEYDMSAVHKDSLATFVVHMQYCKDGTWQGKLIWTDEQKETDFRSSLELIKLMDSAMTSTES
jgi:hypothetical protein